MVLPVVPVDIASLIAAQEKQRGQISPIVRQIAEYEERNQEKQRAQRSDLARQIAEDEERNQERLIGAVEEMKVRLESDMARIDAEMEAKGRIREDLIRRVEAGERDRRELRGRAN
jgi:predicted RNase H-like nuclease (RuvC/YqgF family)